VGRVATERITSSSWSSAWYFETKPRAPAASARARTCGPGADVFVVVHAQDDDCALGRDRAHALGGSDAIQLGHVDVHENDIGLKGRRELQSRLAAISLADHCDVGLDPEPDTDGLTHDGLIIDKEQLDHCALQKYSALLARNRPSLYSRWSSAIPPMA